MRLRALARFLVLLTLLNSGCHKSAPNTDSTGTAKWTLMFYSDADNDLEETAMNDLRQLLKLGESPQVRMVMLCDRSELDSSDDGYSNERIFNQESWDQALLLTIGKEELETVEDWGEVNMADPATLSRFVRTSNRSIPPSVTLSLSAITVQAGKALARTTLAKTKTISSLLPRSRPPWLTFHGLKSWASTPV